MNTSTLKQCSSCGKEKQEKDFYAGPPVGGVPRSMSRCKVCHNARRTKDRARAQQKDPSGYAEKQRLQWRRWHLNRYGLTLADFDDLLARQGCRCGCCGTEEPEYRGWQVDHDHDTGKIRGILCSACNTGIGKLGDSEEGVLRALNYLRATPSGLLVQAKPEGVARVEHPCPMCQTPFKASKVGQQFCSANCRHDAHQKKCPPREELALLVWKKTLREIGVVYAVSDATVKHWCIRLGVETPPLGYWQRRAPNTNRSP